MAVNTKNVLAGIGGLGDSYELAWFADATSTLVLPTDATTALAAGFKSMGYVDENGLQIAVATSSNDIKAYGSFSPIRTLITDETRDFTITGSETNLVTLAIQSRQTLASVTATGGGAVTTTQGPARDVIYSAVFHATDGVNVIRKVVPNIRLISEANEQIAKAQNVAYGFTFRAYPDSTGVTVYNYMLLAGYGAS
jgi:hypothetical protein